MVAASAAVRVLGAGLHSYGFTVFFLPLSQELNLSRTATSFAFSLSRAEGAIEGPIIGAIIFWALNKFFSDYGTWYLLGLGLMAIVVTIFFKQGLWGWLQQRRGWTLFPTQRTLRS